MKKYVRFRFRAFSRRFCHKKETTTCHHQQRKNGNNRNNFQAFIMWKHFVYSPEIFFIFLIFFAGLMFSHVFFLHVGWCKKNVCRRNIFLGSIESICFCNTQVDQQRLKCSNTSCCSCHLHNKHNTHLSVVY